MRVLLVGAYERHNFGDLLFLLLTERCLGGAEVVAAAPFAADMTALLDRQVPAYGPLLDAERFDAIWTVGGQVGAVDLARAYRMSASPAAYRKYLGAVDEEREAILRAAAGGTPLVAPYVPAPLAHPLNADAIAVLNSAGLAGAGPALLSVLRGHTVVRVRDRRSSALLASAGVEHVVAPDAVHAASVVWPAPPEEEREGAVVQISATLLRSLGHGAVADALAGSAALRGLPLRILLAGTATGHDSAAEWEPVVARLRRRGVDVELLGARRPLDLVAAIRRARVVIGTSLHVRVVAASYGVARVSLERRKVTAYAAAWDDAMPAGVELRSLDSAVAAALAAAERPEAREHGAALARRAHDDLVALGGDVRRLVETETEADRAARLELRVRHQAALLAREGVAQRAELARLRREVERLSVPRARRLAGRGARVWRSARRGAAKGEAL